MPEINRNSTGNTSQHPRNNHGFNLRGSISQQTRSRSHEISHRMPDLERIHLIDHRYSSRNDQNNQFYQRATNIGKTITFDKNTQFLDSDSSIQITDIRTELYIPSNFASRKPHELSQRQKRGQEELRKKRLKKERRQKRFEERRKSLRINAESLSRSSITNPPRRPSVDNKLLECFMVTRAEFEICFVCFMLLLIYILTGGIIFRQIENYQEQKNCNAMTIELNNYPNITETIRSKYLAGEEVQLADFYELAHLFTEIVEHKATIIRQYKNRSIIVTGTPDNLRELRELEEEEKRDIEFEYLATSAHDYLNRHTDHSFLVTTELQEHFASKNQGNSLSDSGYLPNKNAQREPYSIKTSKKLDTQTIEPPIIVIAPNLIKKIKRNSRSTAKIPEFYFENSQNINDEIVKTGLRNFANRNLPTKSNLANRSPNPSVKDGWILDNSGDDKNGEEQESSVKSTGHEAGAERSWINKLWNFVTGNKASQYPTEADDNSILDGSVCGDTDKFNSSYIFTNKYGACLGKYRQVMARVAISNFVEIESSKEGGPGLNGDIIINELGVEYANVGTKEKLHPHVYNVSCQDIWGYWDSVYFAGTVVTTIGYGQIAPQTEQGRVFCMFYMVFGTLFFTLFAVSFNRILKYYVRRTRKLFVNKVLESESCVFVTIIKMMCRIFHVKITTFWNAIFTIFCFSSYIFIFIFLPVKFFTAFEKTGMTDLDGNDITWSMLESLYYVMVTVTTIGFGDYVPGKAHYQSSGEDDSGYFWYKEWPYECLTLVWAVLAIFGVEI